MFNDQSVKNNEKEEVTVKTTEKKSRTIERVVCGAVGVFIGAVGCAVLSAIGGSKKATSDRQKDDYVAGPEEYSEE